MPGRRCQVKAGGTSSQATSVGLTFDMPTISGRHIILMVGTSGGTGPATSITMSDTYSNTWTAIGSMQTGSTNPNVKWQMFYAKNITGGSGHQMTATLGGGVSQNISICMEEVADLDLVEVVNQSKYELTEGSTSNTITTTLSAATTREDCYLFHANWGQTTNLTAGGALKIGVEHDNAAGLTLGFQSGPVYEKQAYAAILLSSAAINEFSGLVALNAAMPTMRSRLDFTQMVGDVGGLEMGTDVREWWS